MKTTILASLLIAIGAIFGYFMVLLLPIIFVTWLEGKTIPALKPAAGDIEKEEILSGYMWKKDDGSFTWTWYP